MKNIIKLLFVSGLLFFTSCEKEQDSELFPAQESSSKRNLIPISLPADGYIISALVQENHCGEGKYLYSVYASSGLTKVDYDREVHIGIIHNSNLVEARIVNIRANETLSENVPVFQTPIGAINNVRVKIFAVLKSGQLINDQFDLRDTTFRNVEYCQENFSSGNYPCIGAIGNEGITGSPIDGHDDDGDGLCNGSDPDDNNNGIPDISE